MDILDTVISRVSELATAAKKTDDVSEIRQRIVRLHAWLVADNSLQQMRLLWAMLTYVYNTVGKEAGSMQPWIDDLKIEIGFCRVRQIGKAQTIVCSKCGHKGEIAKVEIVKVPRSLSFANCTQKDRTEFFEKAVEYLQARYNWFKINIWHSEYIKNTNTIQ